MATKIRDYKGSSKTFMWLLLDVNMIVLLSETVNRLEAQFRLLFFRANVRLV